MTDAAALKAREAAVRRAAGRQGLRMEKSHLRDQRAPEYGKYMLCDEATRAVVSDPRWLTLDEVESFLDRPQQDR